MKKEETTYLLARLPIGLSFLGHGLVRLPKLDAFSHGMAKTFGKSMLPQAMVLPFAYTLPVLELATGIFIFFGLFTRLGYVLGSVIMLALIFGSCMIEQWENVFIQLVYSGYLATLFYFAQHNTLSIDDLRRKV